MTRNETLMIARQATTDSTTVYVEPSIRDARLALCRKWRAANEQERQARFARDAEARRAHDALIAQLASTLSTAIAIASEPVFPLVNVRLKAKAPCKSGTYMMRAFFRDVSIFLCTGVSGAV